MAVSSGTSFTLSTVLTVLLFSGMQLYRSWLASTQLSTIFGGYLASVLFLLQVTAIGNLETTLFGKNFQTKLFPEVFICLLVALVSAGMVHRVCVTTCFIFSLVSLYYVNRISQQVHATPVQVQAAQAKAPSKKKK